MLINEAEREIVFTLIEQVMTHNFEKVYEGRENFDRWYWNEKKNLSLVMQFYFRKIFLIS